MEKYTPEQIKKISKYIGDFKKQIEDFDNAEIKIAIVGSNKGGKSTLISSLVNVENNERSCEDASRVKSTSSSTRYTSLGNDKVAFYDIPESTEDLLSIGNQYDALILVVSEFLSEKDLQLVYDTFKKDKSALVVRSEVDKSIDEALLQEQQNGVILNEETISKVVDKIIKETRDKTSNQIKEKLKLETRVFVVSGKSVFRGQYDFIDLFQEIQKYLVDEKLRVAKLVFDENSEESIDLKVKELYKFLKKAVIVNAAVSIVPFGSMGSEKYFISKLYDRCKMAFGKYDMSSEEGNAELLKTSLSYISSLISDALGILPGTILLGVLMSSGTLYLKGNNIIKKGEKVARERFESHKKLLDQENTKILH